jgi:5'-nucleotidase (lipoprotein e(P4) family)
MQSAIEYEATALQAYRLAQLQIDAALDDPRWSALAEPGAGPAALTPAVILDIDETVLDNSYYQARLIRDDTTFAANPTWEAWCLEARATAIPGAVEFTRYAASRGVTVFYVSNRTAAVEQATRANLQALGFPLDGRVDTVLVRGERPEWQASGKGPRRSHVAASHRVVMLVGDDLGDFVDDASGSPEARREASARYQKWWGERWIMLPNPAYGSWERAAGGAAPGAVAAKRASLKVAPPPSR